MTLTARCPYRARVSAAPRPHQRVGELHGGRGSGLLLPDLPGRVRLRPQAPAGLLLRLRRGLAPPEQPLPISRLLR